MIVDVIFVLVIAALTPQQNVPSKSISFQTRDACIRFRGEALAEVPKQEGFKFYMSECTPVPVEEVK